MKIFAYVGTSRNETSKTFEVVKKLVNQIELNSKSQVKYEIYHPENTSIINCTGCLGCFQGRNCPLDKKDDMEMLKKKMLAANVVILGSPVFLHQITGTVKTIIDRTSYWTHLFKLTGKVGLSVSTSSTNGNEHVDYYLDKFQMHQGIYTIPPLSLQMDVLNQNEIEEMIEESAAEIVDAYKNLKKKNPTLKQERSFQAFKKIQSELERRTSESRYWIDNGLVDFESFQEFRNAMIEGHDVKKQEICI